MIDGCLLLLLFRGHPTTLSSLFSHHISITPKLQATSRSFVEMWARDAIKLALLGDGHPVDWWSLPTRLEWARIPDRGILGYQTGSLTFCVAFGRPQRSWVQELKPSSPARFLLVVEAGGRSPGRSLGFDHPRANRCMTNSCRDTEAPPFLGLSTPYLLWA